MYWMLRICSLTLHSLWPRSLSAALLGLASHLLVLHWTQYKWHWRIWCQRFCGGKDVSPHAVLLRSFIFLCIVCDVIWQPGSKVCYVLNVNSLLGWLVEVLGCRHLCVFHLLSVAGDTAAYHGFFLLSTAKLSTMSQIAVSDFSVMEIQTRTFCRACSNTCCIDASKTGFWVSETTGLDQVADMCRY